MWKRIRRNYRRLIAFLLTTAMVITNAGGNMSMIFAAGETENALFLVEGGELREAIREAREQGEAFDFSELHLAAARKSIRTRYEKLLGTKEGAVYALELEMDDSYAPEGTGLQVFYHEGTGDVIFLFLNGSDLVVDYRVNIDGYETEPVRVNPNTVNIETDGEEALSYAENYEAADMIDDEGKKLGAEVLNPAETSGEEESGEAVSGSEAGEVAEETKEQTGAGSREETAGEAGSGTTEESTAAGGEAVNGSDDAENGKLEEKQEDRNASEAETKEKEAEEATTEKAEESTEEKTEETTKEEETEEKTEAAEETASDDEESGAEDGELLSISRHEASLVMISVEEPEGRDRETEEEGKASGEEEDETEEETRSEAEIDNETETKTESEGGTEESRPEGGSKADPADPTKESESGSANGNKPEESTAGTEAEGKPGESEAGTGTEGKPEESEAGTEAGGKPGESEAEGKTEEGGAESSGDLATEETDTSDSTGVSDETDSFAADSDGNSGSGKIEMEGQLLDDTEVLGELKGKKYDTVTILDHVNARAWKIALEEIETVISDGTGCEHEYVDGVCVRCEAGCLHEECDEDGNCMVCGMAVAFLEKEVPAEVIAFLDAVKALEDAVEEKNVEEALACMDACEAAMEALSEEDMEREDVMEAITRMAELMDGALMLVETGTVVDSFEALKKAVEEAGDTPTAITITESFDLTGYLQIEEGQDITLTAREGVVLGRSSEAKGNLWVKGKLTLENIVLDGGKIPAAYAMIHIVKTGKVTMNEGTVVQNAYNNYSAKSYGGGVYNAGILNMTGGTISGNTADSYGGGVYNTGNFTMTGGAISDNMNTKWYGGGVYNGGTFHMAGGEISDNKATNKTYGYGGGVYNTGTFTTAGGEISGNQAYTYGYGGGVYSTTGINMKGTVVSGNVNGGVDIGGKKMSDSAGTFTLDNVTFTGNTGQRPALSIWSLSSWNIKNCTISNNELSGSSSAGSAVYLKLFGWTAAQEAAATASERNLTACVIENNTCKGAALYVECGKGATSIMDCAITNNSGSYGGVYITSNGNTTLGSGTRIERNEGTTTGGVHVQCSSNGTGYVTIGGAVITDNKGTTTGGVFTTGQTFAFKSGAIYGNKKTGDNKSGGNDFYVMQRNAVYSLIKASEMSDPKEEIHFSDLQYSWAGAPVGKEGEALENLGEISLTATANLVRNFAKVGDKEYATLQDALEDVGDNGTIEVIFGKDGFGSKYAISKPFTIEKSVTLKFDGQEILANGSDLFAISDNVTLTLQGSAMMDGKIVVKTDSSLTMDGSIVPYYYSNGSPIAKELIINVQGGAFTINGVVGSEISSRWLTVNLAKGQCIAAGDGFGILDIDQGNGNHTRGGIKITLDDETYTTFNSAVSNEKVDDVVLVEGCSSADVVSRINLTKAFTNNLVRIKVVGNDIVLHKDTITNGVFVDGKNGNDDNNGETSDKAVKTFKKAKELKLPTPF